ncbi:MAG TPA: aminoacyl-tRNA hydrolase [Thermoanaerobaculia bacterium]|jgi:PTH1 family peptidyl-tRNA hydrolase
MKIIVGLGNPGPEYAKTRHNIGWMAVDAFAAKFRIRIDKHEKDAMTGTGRVAGGSVLVAKPLTYMNLSGDAVRLLVNAYAESIDELIIVYDDIDLPLGKLRIRPSGSAGTHNGMRSIVAALGTEKFTRLRVGIGGVDSSGRLRDYVLGEIAGDEEPIVTHAIERSVDALLLFVRSDLKRAMNEFNRDVDAPEGDPAEK